jgi:CubicO group peptidase (beta-lactamase class C family)
MFAVRWLLIVVVVVVGGLVLSTTSARTQMAEPHSARELAGLWEAKRRFGPDVRGSLLIRQSDSGWWAEIAGRSVQAKIAGDRITFELADGKGAFQGRFDARRTRIKGHWVQPRLVENGTPYASPVTLIRDKQNVWRGTVAPLDDALTCYLMIKVRDDGSTGAFLKNPERNLGRFIRVDHIERAGESIKLFAADTANAKARVLAEGKYDADSETLSVYFSGRGSFDFRRVAENESSDFYPRGRPNGSYAYAPPLSLDDGWQTATLEDVGISREQVEKFIRMIIDTPIDSFSSQEVHGVLIARHGKLVLEEYFHGEHREKPHDTRSAAKSLTATLVGASIRAGVPVDVSTPVYSLMNGGEFPPGIEPRKKALTIESLLTMSSGLDCDDSDPESPGNEETMTNQREQPDYYKFALSLKAIRNPGEKAVYCSVQANLIGGALARAAEQSLPVMFENLLAGPLNIKRYYMPLTPNGDAYMGGGVRLLPRDFMKLGQLHLDGGTWNGRRILSAQWSRRATSHLVNLGSRKYGYLWYVEDYPYKGRSVRAFMAAGNGGQIVLGIPELDLLIAFYGGNYSDPALFVPQRVYVPQYILPAVEEGR